MGLDINRAIPPAGLASFPADGTLLREQNRPDVFVVYGGAKSWIPDPPTLHALGFNFAGVSVIPAGGTSKLGAVPIDGTFVRQQADPKVYVVDNGQLRWVTSPAVMDRRCFPWRHVRIVPNGALAALPHGPDLN